MPAPTEPKPSALLQRASPEPKKESESPDRDSSQAARESKEQVASEKSPKRDSPEPIAPEVKVWGTEDPKAGDSPARDGEAEGANSQEAPNEAEIADFLKRNEVDERAAQDLRDCPPDLQRKVLDRGDLNSARNSSAALIVRIRDARMDAKGSSGSKAGMGLPSSSEIKDFIKAYSLDDTAAEALRSSSPTMKRNILNCEEFRHADDVSSLVLSRIGARRGSKGSSGLALEIDTFIKNNDLDRRAAADLKGCAPAIQRDVLSQGDLKDLRNKHAALLSRIREAKTKVLDASQSGYSGYPPQGYPPYGYGYPGYPGYGYPPGYPGYPGYGYAGAYGYPPNGYAFPSAAPEVSGQPTSKRSKGSRSGSYSNYSSYSYSESPSRSPSRKSRKSSSSRSRSRSRSHRKAKKRRGNRGESPRANRGRDRRR